MLADRSASPSSSWALVRQIENTGKGDDNTPSEGCSVKTISPIRSTGTAASGSAASGSASAALWATACSHSRRATSGEIRQVGDRFETLEEGREAAAILQHHRRSRRLPLDKEARHAGKESSPTSVRRPGSAPSNTAARLLRHVVPVDAEAPLRQCGRCGWSRTPVAALPVASARRQTRPAAPRHAARRSSKKHQALERRSAMIASARSTSALSAGHSGTSLSHSISVGSGPERAMARR